MSEDKENDKIENLKQHKDPKQSAISKLKEQSSREYNDKINSQVKKTIDAIKIANNEKKLLAELIEEQKEAIAEFSDLIKGI